MINHEAGQGDLKAVLTYNSTSTPYLSMVVCLDTNLVADVEGDLMQIHSVANESHRRLGHLPSMTNSLQSMVPNIYKTKL